MVSITWKGGGRCFTLIVIKLQQTGAHLPTKLNLLVNMWGIEMIKTEFFKTRKDRVSLYKTMDAQVDANNKLLRDENGNLISTGFLILQEQTGCIYDEAPYTYSTTTTKIKDLYQEVDSEQ